MATELNIGTNIQVTPDMLLGESIAVLGIKGSGKSNTAAVLAEEMLAAGVPICIVDIAGEYWGLKEKYQILVAGKSAHVDIPVTPAQAAELAEFSMRHNLSVILDVSDFRADARFEFLHLYFEAVWRIAGELRRPYQLFLEEAHNFIPQRTTTLVSDILITIATEGRKRGLGIVMIGQRSARIDKDVLTQAGILFLHQVRHPADFSVYQDIVVAERAWVKESVNQLKTGEAIVVLGSDTHISQIRQRHTYHAGYTPGLGDVPAPSLHTLDEQTLNTLRQMLSGVREEKVDEEKRTLQLQLAEQQTQFQAIQTELDEALATIERQKIEIDILSHIHITIDPITVITTPMQSPGDTVASTMKPAAKPNTKVNRPIVKEDSGLVKQQKRRLNTFLDDLRVLPKIDRVIALYFVQRPDMKMTLDKLARHIPYADTTLVRNPPLQAIALSILSREQSRDGYLYQSALDSVLEAKFGELPHDETTQRITEALLSTGS